MKLKLISIVFFVFCFCHRLTAQLKHYIGFNSIVYKNYFNPERDRSYPLANLLLVPNISYKIEQDNLGFEVFCSDGVGVEYYSFSDLKYSQPKGKDRNILRSSSFNVGTAIHYRFLFRKKIQVNAMLGGVKNWYNEDVLIGLGYHSSGWLEVFTGSNKESRFGLLAGVNINVPIWKGIYVNTNTRYMIFPGAQYNKKNLVFDIGFGYMYQRKAKTKRR